MTDTKKPAPVPLAVRVRRSEAALRRRGGKRLPGGSLQPDAAQALDALLASGYAPSATAAIARALVEAQSGLVKRPKRATPSGVKD